MTTGDIAPVATPTLEVTIKIQTASRGGSSCFAKRISE